MGQNELKQLPSNNDLEQIVLGALMLEKSAIYQVIGLLAVEDFFNSKHQAIYAAILRLDSKAFPVDMVTVMEELQKANELDFIGGPAYLAEITNRIASTANLEYHSRILKQKAIRRGVINVSSDLFDKGFDNTIDDLELLEIAEIKFSEISQQRAKNAYQDPAGVAREVIEKNERLAASDEAVLGLPISSPTLNRIISGWQEGKFIVIAGRPGMGKTTFVTSELRYLGICLGVPVGIFSLEMSSEELLAKIVAAEVEVDDRKIKDMRKANDYEMQQIHTGLERFSNSPIYINDNSSTLLEIKSAARLMVREKGVKIIVIDYIQLVTNSIKGANREQEVSSISRQFKQLSRELNVPVIALAQLSRAVEMTADKRPLLSHLRESGSIEQDADLVGFIYRPEYYGITEYVEEGEPEPISLKGIAEFIIAKHRAGELKNVQLNFIPQHSKFKEKQDELFNEPETQYKEVITTNGHARDEEAVPF